MKYQDAKLDDLLGTLIDYRGKTPPKTESGIPLITAKVIKGGRILDGNHEYIAEDYYDEWMRRGLPHQWDVLITTEAPLGEVAILKSSAKVALAQRVILLRGDKEKINQRYLCFALQSPLVQARLNARATGATVAGIKQSELREVLLPVYPLPTQRRIASILSAYDDLIENNTRRIAILEEMARRIYEEWFVRFRFPGHEQVQMVESELGLIPEGWRVVPLGDVSAINAKSIRPANAPDEILYIDIASVVPGAITQKQPYRFSEAPGRARRVVQNGDVIWSCVRPNRRSYALVLQPEAALVASTGFAVLSAKSVPYSYLYFAVTTDDFVGFLTNHATGAAYPAVTASTFESAPFLMPEKEVADRFHAVAAPMLDLSETLKRKNTNLRATRDLLLPKLISGELDVSTLPEPEEAIAA